MPLVPNEITQTYTVDMPYKKSSFYFNDSLGKLTYLNNSFTVATKVNSEAN